MPEHHDEYFALVRVSEPSGLRPRDLFALTKPNFSKLSDLVPRPIIIVTTPNRSFELIWEAPETREKNFSTDARKLVPSTAMLT